MPLHAMIVVSYVLIELHSRNFRLLVYLWRPFRRLFIYFRKQWDIKTSVIEVFATFLLLSNVNVSFDLLTPTEVHNINGSLLGLFLYYDASIAYFGTEHLPYAVLALLLLLIFVFLPVLHTFCIYNLIPLPLSEMLAVLRVRH